MMETKTDRITILCRRCKDRMPHESFAVIPDRGNKAGIRRDKICLECRKTPGRRPLEACLPIPNPNDQTAQTALIPLTKGKFAVIDADDYELVAQRRWISMETQGLWYAISTDHLLLHRLLLGPSAAEEIDHINGDGLDNRKGNLRIATRSQNIQNKTILSTNTSGYRGVSIFHARNGRVRWQATIQKDGVRHSIGLFDDPVVAAIAYDKTARMHFGEFARLNFPLDGEQRAIREHERSDARMLTSIAMRVERAARIAKGLPADGADCAVCRENRS